MKYVIRWDCGFGNMDEVHECKTQEAADKLAYEMWLEDAQSNASFKALPLTLDVAEEYGYEDELKEQPHD